MSCPLSSIRPQRHQGLDHKFSQGPGSGVEAGSRREEQISTDEQSAHRGARRRITSYATNHGPRPGLGREHRWATSWAGWSGP